MQLSVRMEEEGEPNLEAAPLAMAADPLTVVRWIPGPCYPEQIFFWLPPPREYSSRPLLDRGCACRCRVRAARGTCEPQPNARGPLLRVRNLETDASRDGKCLDLAHVFAICDWPCVAWVSSETVWCLDQSYDVVFA